MWTKIAGFIIRQRLPILIFLGLVTLFMAYLVPKNKVSYDLTNLLPKADSTAYAFTSFKEKFGTNDNVYLLATEDTSVFTLDNFNKIKEFSHKLSKLPAVDSVFGFANFSYLEKNVEKRTFELVKSTDIPTNTQSDVDSVKKILYEQPFFERILYVKENHVKLIAIVMNPDTVASNSRNKYVLAVADEINQFAKESGIEFVYSGMPYVRAKLSTQVESEIFIFLILAAILTALILFIFLKSPTAVLISLLVVLVAVTWSLGIVVLLGYKLTILISLIPPLVIVIGIPNCIFLLNKYFSEFKSHNNQAKSLTRVIKKTGNATLMTNATTAAGFATFALTPSLLLKEFGIVASLSILCVFILSILIIPIIYSYLAPPKKKHYKHLDNKWINKLLNQFINISINYRGTVYVITIFLALISGYGISKLNNNALIVDDIKKNDPVMVDLKYFEKNLNGIVPFEIVIDTKKKGRALRYSNLEKLEELYKVLEGYEEFSKPMSILNVIKYSNQAYSGNSSAYMFPTKGDIGFIKEYATGTGTDSDNLLKSLIDDERRELRVSLQMKDVGSKRTKVLMDELEKEINKIFNPEKYDHYFTGISVVVAKGVDMLVSNLILTLLLAIGLISLFMAVMFRNFRMVIISVIPNLLPLVFTASIMGYFGINIKPSTILVFSIAFGISVDDTIHFLAKYRQELVALNGNIKKAVIVALKETGVSMFYTSVVLFFGFGIFVTSNFGGTQALGLLVSLTLLIAMISNLILLPSLLLSLDKLITVKASDEPYIDLLDEKED